MAQPSKRFVKKIPPSGVAPAYKLSLPHSVVHSHLAHLIGQDFELASSAIAEQAWQGSITPRRNKERAEYTLKGWKLFAEAHKVRTGDQYAFELVTPTRLVIQLLTSGAHGAYAPACQPAGTPRLSGQHPVAAVPCTMGHPRGMPGPGAAESPLLSPTSLAAANAPIPTDAGLAAGVPDSKNADAFWTHPLSELAERPPAPAGMSPPEAGQPLSDASLQMLEAHENAHGQASAMDILQDPDMVPFPYESLALPPSGQIGMTPMADMETSMAADNVAPSLPRSSLPSTPHNQHSLADWTTSTPVSSLAGSRASSLSHDHASSHATGVAFRPGSTVDLQMLHLNAMIRGLQKEIGQSRTRVNRAEHEESLLRSFVDDTRTNLQGGLHAVAALERLTNRLVDNYSSRVSTLPAELLKSTHAEMSVCMDTIRSCIWKFLSTDC